MVWIIGRAVQNSTWTHCFKSQRSFTFHIRHAVRSFVGQLYIVRSAFFDTSCLKAVARATATTHENEAAALVHPSKRRLISPPSLISGVSGFPFLRKRGSGVWVNGARVGERRFPRRVPPGAHRGRPYGGRPRGIAPTVVSPAGKMRLRRAGWWRSRVVVGGVAPPCAARRPQGIAPTEGGHEGSPLRSYPLRGRCACVARVGGVVALWWAGLPRLAPPGGHKGSPLRRAATRDRPYGGRPQGIAPTEDGHKGSPLRRAATRDRPYGGRPQGIAPTEGGHKGSPLRRAATRDRPYGGRPRGIAPTVVSPAGKMRLRRAGWWRSRVVVGGVAPPYVARRPRGIAPTEGGHKGSPLRRTATRDRP